MRQASYAVMNVRSPEATKRRLVTIEPKARHRRLERVGLALSERAARNERTFATTPALALVAQHADARRGCVPLATASCAAATSARRTATTSARDAADACDAAASTRTAAALSRSGAARRRAALTAFARVAAPTRASLGATSARTRAAGRSA
jgi:hypothetical protein